MSSGSGFVSGKGDENEIVDKCWGMTEESISMHCDDMQSYLSGERLIGDDYTLDEIAAWYEDEKEAYANLGAKDLTTYTYAYHAVNRLFGFSYLPSGRFRQVLGIGSCYGDEFIPIADRIDNLTVVDSSKAFKNKSVHGVPCSHVEARPDGLLIQFADRHFDLIVCLGVLHHIPNVSCVLGELFRTLRSGGHALIREPIVSMGDWRRPRRGLTKRERGIPLPIFRRIIAYAGFKVLHETMCFFPLTRAFNGVVKCPYNNSMITLFDKIASKIFAWNIHYARRTMLQKIAPTSVFYVLTKE